MCMGKISTGSMVAAECSVHPHVHGENVGAADLGHADGRFTPMCMGKIAAWLMMAMYCIGSPPCAWGKSGPRRSYHATQTVHPHVHGENIFAPLYGVILPRFTPMCMGKISIS